MASESGPDNMKCWASVLGPCGGGHSAEHYFTRSIGNLKVCFVSGLAFARDGKHIGRKALKAHILCEKHNNRLSQVDAAAKALSNHLIDVPEKETFLAEKTIYRGPLDVSVSGNLFARWLAKTYCNIMSLEAKPLARDFVRFAFAEPTEKPIFIYYVDEDAVTAPWDPDSDISSSYFHGNEGSGLCTSFFGFTWVMANVDCTTFTTIQSSDRAVEISTAQLQEKPSSVTVAIPLSGTTLVPYIRLSIDWD